jgi:hypothetical protein
MTRHIAIPIHGATDDECEVCQFCWPIGSGTQDDPPDHWECRLWSVTLLSSIDEAGRLHLQRPISCRTADLAAHDHRRCALCMEKRP